MRFLRAPKTAHFLLLGGTMKKILLLLTAFACILNLAACASRSGHTQTEIYKSNYTSLPCENEDVYDLLEVESEKITSYKRGDVTKDGNVTNSDILLLYKYIYSSTLYPLENESDPSALKLADANKDGKVTNSDILMIYKYIFNPTLNPLEDETATPEEETTEGTKEEETTEAFMGPPIWM